MSAAVPPRAAVRPNTLAELRVLLRGAEAIGGGQGNALQLCLLSGIRIGDAVAARLEDVDWRGGVLRMPAERRTRSVPLSHAAQAAILRACGGVGGRGQLVTCGRGAPIEVSDLRAARLHRMLASTAPVTARIDWTWRSLRHGVYRELLVGGVDHDAIRSFFGFSPHPTLLRSKLAWLRPDAVAEATTVANRWARLLLQPTGSAP